MAAIFSVVFLHVAAALVTETTFASRTWWYGNVYDALVRWCVPVFVMISGALLLDSRKVEDSVTFYRRRAGRLLLPLVAWTVLFLFWNYFKAQASGAGYGVAAAARSVLSGRPYYHMWFLYMLVGLYLFTPLIRTVVRHSSRRELRLLVGVLFVIVALNAAWGAMTGRGTTLFINQFLPYIPYFICGHLIATSNRRGGKRLACAVFVCAVVSTAVGCYLLARWKGRDQGLYFYDYLSVTVIPMSISLMWLFKSFRCSDVLADKLRLLSTLTLGIYLVHPIFLETFRDRLFKPEDVAPLFSVPLLAVLVFGASLALSLLLRALPYVRTTIG